MTTTDFGGDDSANAVLVQSNGKIIAGGMTESDFALARYHADGSLDFKVTTDLGSEDAISRILPAKGGRVVAVGRSGNRVALVWYGTDGAVTRRVLTPLGSQSVGAAPAPGGKIVVTAPRPIRLGPNPPINFVLARYRPDGRLDRTFGGDGIVFRRAPPHWTGGQAVAVHVDGSIIIAGHGHGTRAGFGFVRFRADERFDRTFVSEVGFGVRAITIDRRARIVATGASYGLRDFTVARYTTRGRLDGSFGAVTTDLGDTEDMWAVAVQPDGRVVVAGRSGPDFALARFDG